MNKIITMVISVVVAVSMISIVVIPIIGSGNFERTKTTVLTNTGTSLIEGDVEDDYTIQWDSALPGMVKVNGNVTTVYFMAGQGATVSPTSKNVTVDLTYGELPVPTKTGYTFDGWFTSTQYTTEVTENTVVVGNSDKILYAKWTANEYTVTFDADGGTVNPSTKTVTYGSAYGELPVPEYTGHIFGGWFDDNDNVITSANIVNIAENHTLTARWTLEQYTISFTTDGNGTVDVQSLTADYGTPYTISSNTVTIGSTTVTATPDSYYVFDHWTPSTSGTVEGSMTFMANFNLPPVTISFTAESPGAVDTQSIADVPRGTQYVVTDNTVTITGFPTVTATLPDGYYMTGWNVAQGIGTISEAMTFTAEYELIEIKSVVTGTSTWVVTTDGKLFGCGQNNNGQQGDGTTTNVTTFTQRLADETVANVVGGSTSTWVVTTDGKLFGCGQNANGQQGDGTTTNVTTFTQRLAGETVANVSSTTSTWVVTTDGKLFGCGYNGNGQQGDGTTTNVTTFTQRLAGETVANVNASGYGVIWAITTDGKLFGCGDNSTGQLGDGTTTNVTTFTQCLTNETVANVSPGQYCTWVLTTDGKLFGTGQNNYGQQGSGTSGSGTNITTFTQRLAGETVANVVGGSTSTWVVTTDGKLFGCGYNNRGQQGDGTTTNVTTFTQRLSAETIDFVSTSSGTTWAITTDGKLFGCGYNNRGQQGDGTTTNVTTFTQRLSAETIDFVSVYTETTWAITTDGKLFGCGSNLYGQQGSGTTTDVSTFTQRSPAGTVNITPVLSPQQLNLNPIHLNPNAPFTPIPLSPLSLTANAIVGTDYTFQAGGEDWMLCTVSVGEDQYALALYYAGLTEPLVWDDDVTFTFSNGTMTVENDGQTYTMDYTSIYYKGDGKYVLTNENAYIKDDTAIIGYAIPTSDSGIEVKGNISGLNAISIADGSISIVGATATTEETDYDDVYSLTGITATYDTDQEIECSSIIVPKTVTITETVEDDMIKDILSIIPIFMAISVVIAVIGLFVVKRY